MFGGSGGLAWAYVSPGGINSVKLTYDHVRLTKFDFGGGNVYGKEFDAVETKELACPSGFVVSGVFGTYALSKDTGDFGVQYRPVLPLR